MCKWDVTLPGITSTPYSRIRGVIEQDVLQDMDHPVRGKQKTVGLAWDLVATPGVMRLAPPYSVDTRAECGYSPTRIAELIERGIVKQA